MKYCVTIQFGHWNREKSGKIIIPRTADKNGGIISTHQGGPIVTLLLIRRRTKMRKNCFYCNLVWCNIQPARRILIFICNLRPGKKQNFVKIYLFGMFCRDMLHVPTFNTFYLVHLEIFWLTKEECSVNG